MSASILDIFEQTAERHFDRRALADEERALTFGQARSLARQFAGRITTAAPCVGVMAHRNVYTVPLFFGAAYTNRCYVPLDPEMPAEKRQKIIKNAGIDQILTVCPRDRDLLGPAATVLDPADFDPDAEVPCPALHGDNPLYIIYTSGSTGTPKGVVKSHGAMKSFVDAYLAEFGFDHHTVIGNQTPFFFDASAKDVYLMAACGATLEILPTKHFSFPVRLVEYMNQRQVNFISWVPSALTLVTALNTFSEVKPQYLKRVFFVGEVFAPKHLNKWMAALPQVEYVNLYGSSEICGISCFCRIDEPADPEGALPIGGPLANCDVKLVDDGKPSPDSGEIYVASEALAHGYFKDPERTAQSFVTTDLGDGPKRYYRTGDIATRDQQGRLVFLCRRDHQIKHMGHRIELGEIEAAVTALDGVEKCCCLYDAKKSKLVLYIQPRPGTELDLGALRGQMKQKLSDYMMPQRIKVLDPLPLNANGKIDRTALQQL